MSDNNGYESDSVFLLHLYSVQECIDGHRDSGHYEIAHDKFVDDFIIPFVTQHLFTR